MKKKALSISLMLVLILSVFTSGVSAKSEVKIDKNNNGVTITTEEFNNLISLGFNEEHIQNMGEEEFLLNKDLKGEVVGSSTEFVKIIESSEDNKLNGLQTGLLNANEKAVPKIIKLDKDTYFKEVDEYKRKKQQKKDSFSIAASDDSTATSYKRMTTVITKLSSTSYRLYNEVTWDKLPLYRYVDVSGVGINQTYWGPVANSQYGSQYWTTYSICNGANSDSATYNTSSTMWQKGAGGYALKMNLPDDKTTGGCAADAVTSLGSYMYYTVSLLATTDRIDAYGHYAHQEANYTLSPGISISGLAFSVSPSAQFSIHPNTHAQVFR